VKLLLTLALWIPAGSGLSSAQVTAPRPQVIFDTEIVPVLTRYGCNSGACHGSAAGRGGLKLSLYGSHPEADYESIAFGLRGRRVNPAHPDDSLVLLKPTETLSHGGGQRFDRASAAARLLRDWISQGAVRGPEIHLSDYQVSPQSTRLDQPGRSVRFKATAVFSDGTRRDVSAWTIFKAEDSAAVETDADSVVAVRRGRHIITARFLDRVVACEILVPFNAQMQPAASGPDTASGFIDRLIDSRLQELQLPASPQIGNQAFLRRVTLDLTGRLPTVADVRAAGEDKRFDRKQLVHRILNSEAFTDYWTHRLIHLLRVQTQPEDRTAARTFHNWIRSETALGTPFDQLVRQLITATGDTHTVGPASFYLAAAGARGQAEYTSEVLMGTRLRCANCHDHPLDHWTQDDYHGLSAIFARIRRGRVISLGATGEVSHPRTGTAAVPRIPGGQFLDPAPDHRRAFAAWLTSRKNPYFARAIVNRLWKMTMNRGLVEPVDDLRSTNPATHPQLLTQLAGDFADHGFEIRHTLALICTSRVYSRSSTPLAGNSDDDRFLSRAIPGHLSPAVLVDAVSDVTGMAEPFNGEPQDTRAIALSATDIPSQSLDVLGRCSGRMSCETGSAAQSGLPTALHLINGAFLNQRLVNRHSRLQTQLAAGIPPVRIFESFYTHALSRFPTDKERLFLQEEFQKCRTPVETRQLAEDLLWSLLTCQEFLSRR